ncbi:hypothetical protein, partial [Campylobacter troglodytis]|uniref:hypothetical protein n=1 Tax=Campylobacter troglodytis TaxID=654363 RepID=UPI001C8D52E8
MINYSIVVAGAGSSVLLEEYMVKQGVAKGINTFYQYKLIGNFGIFSYLFKKAEGKDDKRAIQETIFESSMSYAFGKIGKNIGTSAKQIAKKSATKASINLASKILARSVIGATIGTSFAIVGTIIGAVVGAFIAGLAEDWYFKEGLFEDKGKKQKLDEEQTQDKLCEIYITKLNLIKDYLLRNNYIELRALNEAESEELCKYLSNPKINHFAIIQQMLSYKNYLQQDKNSYEENKSQKSIDNSLTTPNQAITQDFKPLNPHSSDTFSFKLIIKDYDSSKPLKNKEI